jgi:hypothetical protein
VASAIANVFPQGSHFLSKAARPATYAVEQWAYCASQVSKRSPIRILLLFLPAWPTWKFGMLFGPVADSSGRATRDAGHGGV